MSLSLSLFISEDVVIVIHMRLKVLTKVGRDKLKIKKLIKRKNVSEQDAFFMSVNVKKALFTRSLEFSFENHN